MPQEFLQVAFLVRARGMILLEFYLVLKNVFALSACKLNEQKRPAEVFGHGNEGAFLRQQATCLCGSDTSGQIQFFSRLHKSLRWPKSELIVKRYGIATSSLIKISEQENIDA